MTAALPTLLMSRQYSGDSIRLRQAALQRGWSVERLGSWRAPVDVSWAQPGRALALYGAVAFCTVVADQLGLRLLEPPLDWLASPCCPPEHRGRSVEALSLAEVVERPGPLFIKPADEKLFVAEVYPDPAALAEKLERLGPETPCLVAQPLEILDEWRGFVLDGQLLTQAPYVLDGQITGGREQGWPTSGDRAEQARSFAEEVLAHPDLEIPPAIVLDVARTAEDQWLVLELNPAWGSGLYGCDADRALEVISRACVWPEALAEEEARRWVIVRGDQSR